jgi:hypothetical protein
VLVLVMRKPITQARIRGDNCNIVGFEMVISLCKGKLITSGMGIFAFVRDIYQI